MVNWILGIKNDHDQEGAPGWLTQVIKRLLLAHKPHIRLPAEQRVCFSFPVCPLVLTLS